MDRTQFVRLGRIGFQLRASSSHGVPTGSLIGPKAAIMYRSMSAEQLGREIRDECSSEMVQPK